MQGCENLFQLFCDGLGIPDSSWFHTLQTANSLTVLVMMMRMNPGVNKSQAVERLDAAGTTHLFVQSWKHVSYSSTLGNGLASHVLEKKSSEVDFFEDLPLHRSVVIEAKAVKASWAGASAFVANLVRMFGVTVNQTVRGCCDTLVSPRQLMRSENDSKLQAFFTG